MQPYFVHEEEVPRAGVIVTRKFQRARGPNGEVFTWIGRRKETGRGEGASGLGVRSGSAARTTGNSLRAAKKHKCTSVWQDVLCFFCGLI